jgi:hypothetical protein
MLKFVFAALLALSIMVPNLAFACPQGYAACGESGQLCCPAG